MRIIAELGSCHMGKLERIKEAVDVCKNYGMELKLQLFPNEAPYVPANIHLPKEMFLAAKAYADSIGVILSASVFDMDSLIFLQNQKPSFIKLAFSKKDKAMCFNGEINWAEGIYLKGIEPIVSCDVMTDRYVSATATKLYCIPEYPVRYEVNFDELFPRFDGFSDHTLGLRQSEKAVRSGAKVIEKHVRLGYDDETCPDASFAVHITELVAFKRRMESEGC